MQFDQVTIPQQLYTNKTVLINKEKYYYPVWKCKQQQEDFNHSWLSIYKSIILISAN